MRLLILLTFLLTSCARDELETAYEFGEYLKNIVVDNNQEDFLDLPCFPADCIDDNDVDYVFGSNSADGFIKSFLSRSNIKI